MSKPLLFILSAPSGTGKNAVFDTVKKRMPEVQRCVTATTRAPREKEVNGVDYVFLSNEEFDARTAAGDFIEQAQYDTARYGVLRSEVERFGDNVPVFLIIDIQGKKRIVSSVYPQATTIFLAPPSFEELEYRIKKRGDNTPEEIARRIAIARNEMKEAQFYDHVVINDVLDECADDIIAIIRKTMNA